MPEVGPDTLDEARELFEANPSSASAEVFARMAAAYRNDGMISAETYDAIIHQVRPHLTA